MNFDKYEHITPESEQPSESVVAQSETLATIRAKFDDVTSLISVYLTELSSFDKKKHLLEQKEIQLKEFERDLDEKEKEIYRKMDSIDREKAFIVSENKSLKEREMKLNQQKNYAQEIEKGKAEWEAIKQEVMRKQYDVDAQTKKRQADLAEAEAYTAAVAKSDAERKKLLDLREKRIAEIEKQRRIEASV